MMDHPLCQLGREGGRGVGVRDHPTEHFTELRSMAHILDDVRQQMPRTNDQQNPAIAMLKMQLGRGEHVKNSSFTEGTVTRRHANLELKCLRI